MRFTVKTRFPKDFIAHAFLEEEELSEIILKQSFQRMVKEISPHFFVKRESVPRETVAQEEIEFTVGVRILRAEDKKRFDQLAKFLERDLNPGQIRVFHELLELI